MRDKRERKGRDMTATQTIAEFLQDSLDNFQRQGAAAFTDGDFEMNVLWAGTKDLRGKKYRIMRDDRSGTFAFKFDHDLSVFGFHNCMWHWLNNDGSWPSVVKYNDLADQCRVKYVAEQNAIKRERDEKEARERAEHEAWEKQRQELVASIDGMVALAKFKKSIYDLRGENNSIVETVSGWTYKGLGVHKHAIGKVSQPYQVTHLGSGLSMGIRFESLTAAKTAIVRIADSVIGNFETLSTAEILANPSFRRLVRAIGKVNDPYAIVE